MLWHLSQIMHPMLSTLSYTSSCSITIWPVLHLSLIDLLLFFWYNPSKKDCSHLHTAFSKTNSHRVLTVSLPYISCILCWQKLMHRGFSFLQLWKHWIIEILAGRSLWRLSRLPTWIRTKPALGQVNAVLPSPGKFQGQKVHPYTSLGNFSECCTALQKKFYFCPDWTSPNTVCGLVMCSATIMKCCHLCSSLSSCCNPLLDCY